MGNGGTLWPKYQVNKLVRPSSVIILLRLTGCQMSLSVSPIIRRTVLRWSNALQTDPSILPPIVAYSTTDSPGWCPVHAHYAIINRLIRLDSNEGTERLLTDDVISGVIGVSFPLLLTIL